MYTVKRQRVNGVQVGCSTADLKEQGIQCSYAKVSYKRNKKEKNFTAYDDLLLNLYLWEKDYRRKKRAALHQAESEVFAEQI